jgi:hypothetical protein
MPLNKQYLDSSCQDRSDAHSSSLPCVDRAEAGHHRGLLGESLQLLLGLVDLFSQGLNLVTGRSDGGAQATSNFVFARSMAMTVPLIHGLLLVSLNQDGSGT